MMNSKKVPVTPIGKKSLKPVATLKRETIEVSKSGNTTKTKYPAKNGSGGAMSQLTKVEKSYSKKMK